MRTFLFTIFLPIFLVGGLTLGLVVGPLEVARAREHRSWASVEGRITQTEVTEMTSRKGRRYLPVVAYEYEVAGRTYRSNRLTLHETPEFHERSAAERALSEFEPRSPATVFFNPEKPEEAALETSSLVRAWLVVAAGLAMLGLSCAILVRRRRSAPSSGPRHASAGG